MTLGVDGGRRHPELTAWKVCPFKNRTVKLADSRAWTLRPLLGKGLRPETRPFCRRHKGRRRAGTFEWGLPRGGFDADRGSDLPMPKTVRTRAVLFAAAASVMSFAASGIFLTNVKHANDK